MFLKYLKSKVEWKVRIPSLNLEQGSPLLERRNYHIGILQQVRDETGERKEENIKLCSSLISAKIGIWTPLQQQINLVKYCSSIAFLLPDRHEVSDIYPVLADNKHNSSDKTSLGFIAVGQAVKAIYSLYMKNRK